MTEATATKSKAATKAADAKEAPKKIDASEAVNALRGVFNKQSKVGAEHKIEVEGDLVADNLPPDLDMATIKRVEKFRTEVIAAATGTLGDVGLPYLKKNKDVNEVGLSFKFGGDTIDLTLHRQKEFSVGSQEKTVKHGYVQASYTVKGTSNSGEFKKMRTAIGEEAAKLFG